MVCRREPFQLADFCQRVLDEQLSVTNRKCPIELHCEIDAEAEGDEALLRHILNNLISNAVKYSAEGSPVRLRVRRDGAIAIFEVQDDGIGIEPADQKLLFTAFQRGKNVGTIPGTGLGLVIVKRCADLHGGLLSLESEPNKGSRFIFRVSLFPPTSPQKKISKTRARKT